MEKINEQNNIPEVEINTAFVWTCLCCHQDNFEYALPADEQVMQDIKEQEGYYEFESSPFDNPDEWIAPPINVTCKQCGAVYRTYEPDDDIEDEEDEEENNDKGEF